MPLLHALDAHHGPGFVEPRCIIARWFNSRRLRAGVNECVRTRMHAEASLCAPRYATQVRALRQPQPACSGAVPLRRRTSRCLTCAPQDRVASKADPNAVCPRAGQGMSTCKEGVVLGVVLLIGKGTCCFLKQSVSIPGVCRCYGDSLGGVVWREL